MNTFATLELLERGRKATFYTVKLEHDGDADNFSETEKFYDNYSQPPEYADDLAEISNQIAVIARRGLRGIRLRAENGAFAFPSRDRNICSAMFTPNPEAPLRLYCIVVSDEVIVLCNGGAKDAHQVQHSSIAGHFRLANQLERRLEEYLRELPGPRNREILEAALENFGTQL